MRVGIKAGNISATSGGAFAFQSAILGALSAVSCPHEIVLLQSIQGEQPPPSLFQRAGRRCQRLVQDITNTQPKPQPEVDAVGQAALQQEIDVLWHMLPLARPVPVPYIATVWDLAHRCLPLFPEVSVNVWKWQDREDNYQRLLPRACRVLTGTNAGKNEIVSFYGVSPDNVRVIPFPVDDRFRKPADPTVNIRAKYGIPGRYVFYPAQFWTHKNHVNLLLALERYNNDHPLPLHLVLTGGNQGNLDHVMSTIRQLELSAFVHVLGFVPQEDLPAIYAQSEAMVFPTFFGPDNLPPLEAFAVGCPVVASQVQGAEEQLGDAAILFNPSDSADMADAMARVVDDPIKRSELIDRGLRKVAGLTPENYVRKVYEIFDEIEPMRRCWGKTHIPT
ncbi:MAG: glycosyltransferase family 1 protein [Terracidiphilus sp.]